MPVDGLQYEEKGEMLHFPTSRRVVLALIVSCLILFTLILLTTTNTLTNVSAVEANAVGVYWDSSCSKTVSSIAWGTLTPGSQKNIVVYIRNEAGKPTYLEMLTSNWNPSKASGYITLRWNYAKQRMNINEILKITLTLSVSRYIEGISTFSFDILIAGSSSFPGDINGDGTLNIADLVLISLAFGSKLGDPNWNPNADLNQDGLVDIVDIVRFTMWFE